MDIAVIGVSAEAVEIYRYFLRHPGDSVGSARQRLADADPERIQAVVEELGLLGLLDIKDRHRVVATEPRVGIERLIEKRLDELNMEIRRVLETRDVIATLEEDLRGGESSHGVLAIERVEGLDEVRRRIDDLGFFCYEQTLALHPGGPLSPGAIETGRVVATRNLRRGLAVREVYHPTALGNPLMDSYLRDLASLGAQIRITEAQMDRMVIFDSVAVVAIHPKESHRGALLVREPGLVSQLITYFDGVWNDAVDLRNFTEPSTEVPQLSELERRVLSVMATADKDEVAAREIDVSVRTYRRYVADLMARLGAVNRFQAALRAKEENWI
ncbi:hypothetical protein ABGB18_01250 [Nonomuraea sp. B12E4]|uniref:helix-turn-helix transcriptional regulator n=1 Tax=Nonomuraea sp. B12E4 TaxID=3153564 RepID=UPI00325E5E3C